MKTKNLFLSLAIVFAGFTTVLAQEIPQPSPKATVSQVVGLTEIGIEYSSPAVNNRKIWGALVPYNEMWRTGANKATKITFNKPVDIQGKTIPAGAYSLFTIPGEKEWTVIINKDSDLSGTNNYKQENDVHRFKVTPVASPMRERMAFLVDNFNMNEATVALEWEKLRVPFQVKVKTDEQAMESIKSTLSESWRPYNNAARYLLDNKKDLDLALQYANTSISLSNEWFNNWVKAQILAEKGNYKEALKHAQTAKELGDKSGPGFFFKSQVEKALVDWKNKK